MRIIDGNIFEAMRMVLPEHRVLMERLKKESGRRELPVLSDDALAEMQYVLSDALENGIRIRATLFHAYGHQIVHGFPQISGGRLYLQTQEERVEISIERLIKLEYPVCYD